MPTRKLVQLKNTSKVFSTPSLRSFFERAACEYGVKRSFILVVRDFERLAVNADTDYLTIFLPSDVDLGVLSRAARYAMFRVKGVAVRDMVPEQLNWHWPGPALSWAKPLKLKPERRPHVKKPKPKALLSQRRHDQAAKRCALATTRVMRCEAALKRAKTIQKNCEKRLARYERLTSKRVLSKRTEILSATLDAERAMSLIREHGQLG
jgi:hypothetical protein